MTNRKDAKSVIDNMLSNLLPIIERTYGIEWPNSYFAFDTETSGFSRDKDLILEWGHCLVEDGKVVDRMSMLINWFDSKDIPAGWLEQRLEHLDREMRIAARTWRITPDRLRKEGVPPETVLPWLHELLKTIKDRNMLFVSHNGWNFDSEMITSHFSQDLGIAFEFPVNQMLDTGAIVKAVQMAQTPAPKPNESMKDYFKRISHMKAPGIKWNLDGYCVPHFKLVEKYGLDATNMHSAGEDAHALHCLMQEFRKLRSTETAVVAPRSAELPAPSATRRVRGQRNR